MTIFGKGSFSIIGVTFIATFFLMYNATESGLRSTPSAFRLITRLYGGGAVRFVWTVALPHARSDLIAGLALTVPRMIGAAMLAEYLLTLDGWGGVVYLHRSYDFGVLWVLGVLSGIAGMQISQQVGKFARRFRRDTSTLAGLSWGPEPLESLH
jgi:ABC-type nitrate/sulfonate/bicarbonate transport system permease component